MAKKKKKKSLFKKFWREIRYGYRYDILSRYFWKDNFIKPYNKLKIRNISRRYHDIDTIMFHAVMTLLCRYVESECGGSQKFDEYVEQCKEEFKKHEANPHDPEHMIHKSQVEREMRTQALYKEYISTDWDNLPFNPNDPFSDDRKIDRMMKEAFELYKGWWT